jgi:N-acetylmuramoyl-L-alanine amidase
MLEDQGAKVLITRTQSNYTAFNQSYTDWFRFRRFKVLDSLVSIKEITATECLNYKKLSKDKLFWHFFRDYELVERSRKINNFAPHLSIIIHYNVDEKNAPWTKATVRNTSMCFIPGGFAAMDLKKTINKLHFIRLMVSDQIKNSEIIGNLTINAFQKNLKISTAKQIDADYLMKHSLVTGDGVFCRNLILTRYINSPLVYGESLYQDNNIECTLLNNCNYNSYGISVPQRVYQVAKSYYEAVIGYFKDPKIRTSDM